MAANFALTPERWSIFPHPVNPRSATYSSPSSSSSSSSFDSHHQCQLHLFPLRRRAGIRVFSTRKEQNAEVTSESKRRSVITGPSINGDKKDPILDGQGSIVESSRSIGDEEEFDWKWPPWKDMPPRLKLIGTTSLAFVICNMDKVNLSVAIIPMSHEFGWNSSTAGLVQSSFFWGYALSQLPGGWLAKLFGGRKVLEIGVLAWSLATIFVPFAAGFMPALVLSRILVGIGEGVSPSAATDLIASWYPLVDSLQAKPGVLYPMSSIPLQERSRAVSFVFGGLSIGSVLGLLLAPPLIQNFGWESVFFIFGFLGILWCLGFQLAKEGTYPLAASYASGRSSEVVNGSFLSSTFSQNSWNTSLRELSASLKDVPWRAFFKSHAVWAMIYAHFCGSWGHYTCLSWLPSYFSEELDLNLTDAAWVSILPPLASILVTSIAAPFADNLISSGIETTMVRKICQSIAFLSPAICMTLSSLDLGIPPWEVVVILTSGLALSSFALSGLYCTHQDISPEYASILLGITNTVGAVPGIVGVALTGYLLDSTHSWSISLFAPSIFFYLTGTVVWLAFASSKPQNFSKSDAASKQQPFNQ